MSNPSHSSPSSQQFAHSGPGQKAKPSSQTSELSAASQAVLRSDQTFNPFPSPSSNHTVNRSSQRVHSQTALASPSISLPPKALLPVSQNLPLAQTPDQASSFMKNTTQKTKSSSSRVSGHKASATVTDAAMPVRGEKPSRHGPTLAKAAGTASHKTVTPPLANRIVHPAKQKVDSAMSEPSRSLMQTPYSTQKASEEETRALWSRYKSHPGNPKLREKLILNYLHLVRYVVSRLPITLPTSISQEDLMSYGTIGLMEAVERFDLERGLKFETYAVTRIRGSIIDQLRLQDWIPRGVRKRSKDLGEAMVHLEEKLGRAPHDDELAEHLGVTKAKLTQMLAESNNLVLSLDDNLGGDSEGNSLSLKDLVEDKNSPDPQGEYEAVELRKRLADAINSLPEREKLLVALYYHENMTLKEIGEVIRVSESRVCQLHAQAILRLRNKLSQI